MPSRGQTFDVMSLTDQEATIILAVLQKDDLEMTILDTKICELRKEIQDIRKAGALTSGDDQNYICARCKFKFSPLKLPWFDHGARCSTCKFRVCARCYTRQSNGSILCSLCLKYRQEKLLTGEWMSREKSASLHGSELLKSLLQDRRRVPPASDEPKVGSYTQRPALTKDVDSESRTSKNSQSSSEQTEKSLKDTESGITSGYATRTSTPQQRNQAFRPSTEQSSIPTIAVTAIGSQDSRESIYSVYSDAGEVNYGRIPVTGEILFAIAYNHKCSTLEVHVKQCRDLAPVDTKHSKSDPYVKTYLLPDKSRSSKRKTRIKKHTLNPVFDEVLKYQISNSELESRSLWLTVWHNDRLGRNDFLGEVTIPLDCYKFDQEAPIWYTLQERVVTQDPVLFYKGDLFIALKYIPADMVQITPKKKSNSFRRKNKEKEIEEPALGEVHVLVREAKNLTAMRGSAGSNPFCKGYIQPDVSHTSKQKTPVIKKTTNPQWQHILVFEGIDQSQLHEYGIELTIWDYEKLSSNDFLGGVRLNSGQGYHQGKPADWMDARGEEIEAWQNMIDHPNEWVDAELPLRASMGKQSVKG